MKINVIKLLVVFGCISIFSCTKETKETIIIEGGKPIKSSSAESLSEEDLAFWDNSSTVNLNINDILLPNGMTFSQYKLSIGKTTTEGENRNLLLMLLGEKAHNIINYTNPDFATNIPKQTKLAYSWNSKDYTNPSSDPNGCPESIYGLDCSGFLYNVFKNAGFNGFKVGAADDQRKEAHLSNVFSKTGQLTNAEGKNIDLKNMVAKDFGEIPPASMLTGDIIYWLDASGRAKHIGIILKNGSGISVAQSNGHQNEESDTKNSNDCEKNYGANRGPRFTSNVENSIKSTANGGFGDSYGIVRCLEKTPCNAKTISGGFGVTPTLHSVGSKSGTIQLNYEMYSIPDKLEVFYEGKLLFSTNGFVSGNKTESITYNYNKETEIEVIVTGNDAGTAWEYTVNCPE